LRQEWIVKTAEGAAEMTAVALVRFDALYRAAMVNAVAAELTLLETEHMMSIPTPACPTEPISC